MWLRNLELSQTPCKSQEGIYIWWRNFFCQLSWYCTRSNYLLFDRCLTRSRFFLSPTVNWHDEEVEPFKNLKFNWHQIWSVKQILKPRTNKNRNRIENRNYSNENDFRYCSFSENVTIDEDESWKTRLLLVDTSRQGKEERGEEEETAKREGSRQGKRGIFNGRNNDRERDRLHQRAEGDRLLLQQRKERSRL